MVLHEDIPCNLAPAHFMVHIAYTIKLRSRETLIKSLSDLALVFSYKARNKPLRIVSYLRRVITKRCMEIHVKSDND